MSYIPLTFKIKGKIHPRSQFSAQEDEKLTNLVKLYGDDNWDDISNLMKNRNVRKCKERWFNYLAPNVKNCPWTPEEDFPEVFIRMDENNNCIISGPPDKVNKLKEQIAKIVMEEGSTIDDDKLKSIKSFEFQIQ